MYVRLGIRLLYKGARGKMEGARGLSVPLSSSPINADDDVARKLLKSMSIKQGRKYDSPESKADIPNFIAFHNLDVSEIREPIDSFSQSSPISSPHPA